MGAITADREARYLERVSDESRLLDEMVQRMCGGDGGYEGLPAICAVWDVPYGRVLAWLMADESRYAVYARALEMQAKGLVSETVALADGGGEDVARDKLRVDTRFRLAKYHDNKTYGDKVEHSGLSAPVFLVTINAGVQPATLEAYPQAELVDGPVL